jgi:hypothetical protein
MLRPLRQAPAGLVYHVLNGGNDPGVSLSYRQTPWFSKEFHASARRLRINPGCIVYHVLDRGAPRYTIFATLLR